MHNNFSLFIATENMSFKNITQSFSDSYSHRSYHRSLCWSPWSPGVSAGLQYSPWSPGVSLGLQRSLLVSSSLPWSPGVSAGVQWSCLVPGSLLVSISRGPSWSPLVPRCLVSLSLQWSTLVSSGLLVCMGLTWFLGSLLVSSLQGSLLVL